MPDSEDLFKIGGGGLAALLLILFGWWLHPNYKSVALEKERIEEKYKFLEKELDERPVRLKSFLKKEFEDSLASKDKELAAKDKELAAKDAQVKALEAALVAKDVAIAVKEDRLKEEKGAFSKKMEAFKPETEALEKAKESLAKEKKAMEIDFAIAKKVREWVSAVKDAAFAAKRGDFAVARDYERQQKILFEGLLKLISP